MARDYFAEEIESVVKSPSQQPQRDYFAEEISAPPSIQTMGARYLTEHPFKSFQEGILTTATGKGFGERAFQAMEPPVSEQVTWRQNPQKALAQTASQAVAGMVGDVADMYTSPMTYATMGAGPLVSGAGKTLSKIPALAQFGARTGRLLRPVTETAKNIGNYPLENLLPKSPINEAFKLYQRSFGSKIKNLGDVGKIKEQRLDGLNTIQESIPEFKFTDLGTGEQIIGQAPKNRWEFVQAFKQTKEAIWKEINKMSGGATEAGAKIDIAKVIKESQDAIKNKYGESIKVFNPKKGVPTIEVQMNNILKNANIKSEMTPTEAQQALAYLNNQVKGLRDNGQAVDYTIKDFLDTVRYKLSDATDEAIQGAIDQSGYKDLRYKYANLKSMEKEAIKAADSFMREQAGREAGVLHPIINIVSLEDMMAGFIMNNPQQIARGAGFKAVGKLYDFMKSPDRKIPEMFALLDDAKKINALKKSIPTRENYLAPKVPSYLKKSIMRKSYLAPTVISNKIEE